jgi:hypothetical protein
LCAKYFFFFFACVDTVRPVTRGEGRFGSDESGMTAGCRCFCRWFWFSVFSVVGLGLDSWLRSFAAWLCCAVLYAVWLYAVVACLPVSGGARRRLAGSVAPGVANVAACLLGVARVIYQNNSQARRDKKLMLPVFMEVILGGACGNMSKRAVEAAAAAVGRRPVRLLYPQHSL